MDSGSYLPIYKVRTKISKVEDLLAADILFKTYFLLDFSQHFGYQKLQIRGFLFFSYLQV